MPPSGTRETTVLITGASGLLGRSVYKVFKEHQQDGDWPMRVLGTAFTRADPSKGLLKLNLLDTEAVKQVVYGERPDFIVHAAAERRPDRVEDDPEYVEKLNIQSVWTIAQCAANIGAHFVQISTDYVFDGSSPPYSEHSYPNPLNAYGMSKLRAEYTALGANPSTTILRVPVLYGQTTNLDESAVTTLVSKVKNQEPCKEDNYCQRFPTLVDDVSRVLLRVFCKCRDESAEQDVTFAKSATCIGANGHFHFSSPECFTKYQMCQVIGRILNVDTEHMTARNEEPAGAKRPKDCQLSIVKLEKLLQKSQTQLATPFEEGLALVLGS
eukprot:gb/GECG01014211.1/.p1 GENE.gb/GECG01014211.1/~~gb/GECG01014211.1/.p1  ORF type:complete len:326 (+),score=30.95 gb/GECG01014211.1/:1-978(+)